MRRALVAVGLVVLMLPWTRGAPASASAPTRAPASSAPKADFNGDGFADLAVGEYGESVGDAFSSGAVNVLHGSACTERLPEAGAVTSVGSRGDSYDCETVGRRSAA